MSNNTAKKSIALSFDIEDWFTVRNMRDFFKLEDWDQQELRVRIGLDFILSELEQKNIKATFFILGWIADKCPQLVKDIDLAGHEICTHGYSHTPIDLLTPESFEEDLKKSIDSLFAITGKKVKGFRAPSFSITKDTLWAIDILKRNGIEYDSSIFSIVHPDYGINNFPTAMTYVNGLLEVPMRKGKLYGANIPVCGGGYFRLLPYALIKSALRQTLNKESFVMYFHPWEFDPDQPKIGLSKFKKFRHYVGLNSNRKKFQNLLNDFNFTTIEDLIKKERLNGEFKIY
jgi:polysaccharide deacetylase family protein (PEP-CTERM system associated)